MTSAALLPKSPWSAAEDRTLFEAVSKHGAARWTYIAKFLPSRTGKQCRERWINHIDPNVVKGHWSEEEDQTILYFVKTYGFRWSMISQHLSGRTDSSVKNRFNGHLKKLIDQGKINLDSVSMPASLNGKKLDEVGEEGIKTEEATPKKKPQAKRRAKELNSDEDAAKTLTSINSKEQAKKRIVTAAVVKVLSPGSDVADDATVSVHLSPVSSPSSLAISVTPPLSAMSSHPSGTVSATRRSLAEKVMDISSLCSNSNNNSSNNNNKNIQPPPTSQPIASKSPSSPLPSLQQLTTQTIIPNQFVHDQFRVPYHAFQGYIPATRADIGPFDMSGLMSPNTPTSMSSFQALLARPAVSQMFAPNEIYLSKCALQNAPSAIYYSTPANPASHLNQASSLHPVSSLHAAQQSNAHMLHFSDSKPQIYRTRELTIADYLMSPTGTFSSLHPQQQAMAHEALAMRLNIHSNRQKQ